MSVSLRSNSSWQLLQTLSSTGTELAVLLTFAAFLSAPEFGALAVALSACKVLFLLCEPRIHEFLTPKLGRYLDRHRRGSWMWVRWSRRVELGLNLLALLLCVAVAFVLPHIVSFERQGVFLAAAVYTGANTLLKFSSLAILRCLDQIKVAATLSSLSGIGRLTLLWACISTGMRPEWILPMLATVAALAALTQAGIAERLLRARLGAPPTPLGQRLRPANRAGQRRLLFSNYGTGLIEIAHRELDVQIAAWLSGPAEAGRYRVAKTLAMMTLEALNPVVLVLLPEFARRIASDTAAQTALFVRKVTRMLAGIGAIAGTLVIAGIVVYLTWITKAQQNAWLPALILTATFSALAPWLWAQAWLVASGNSASYLRSSAIGATLSLALALVLVPFAGATGSAVAHAVGLAVTTVLAMLFARRTMSATWTR